MTEIIALPIYRFRPNPPSLWDLLRTGVSDVASVIPKAILHQPAVQLPGPAAPLVVSDPDLVRQVLNDRDNLFTRDHILRRLFRRSWGKGLAAAEGEDWQRQRRAASPAFRPSAIAQALGAFAEAADLEAQNWPQDRTIDLPGQVARIVARIVFGVLVETDGRVDPAEVAATMPDYLAAIGRFGLLDLAPMPEAVHDAIRGISRNPAVRRIRAIARSIADSRTSSEPRGDLIALLTEVGPAEDNIRGLFPAAMDTTVSAASWLLYTLALRPEWQARLAAEARAAGDDYSFAGLPQTRRAAQEAMRLYPPAPFLVRTAAADQDLGGHRISRGHTISLSIYAMHRHRRHWDDPDQFDPDRFLPERGHAAAYMPFGTGPRMCIAAQFALAEVMVIVARLLAEFELSPADPAAQVSLKVTTRSTTGLNVTARRRP